MIYDHIGILQDESNTTSFHGYCETTPNHYSLTLIKAAIWLTRWTFYSIICIITCSQCLASPQVPSVWLTEFATLAVPIDNFLCNPYLTQYVNWLRVHKELGCRRVFSNLYFDTLTESGLGHVWLLMAWSNCTIESKQRLLLGSHVRWEFPPISFTIAQVGSWIIMRHVACILFLEWSTTSQGLWVYRISVPYAQKDPRFLFEKRRGQPREFWSLVSTIDGSTLPQDCVEE